jgi:hypothetical protein
MSQVRSDEIYYPISWIKTTTDLFFNLFSSPQKTKRSLPEEAESGSVEGIKCWLREGADINAPDAYGYTPLMNAAMLGRLHIVKVLIELGADVQKKRTIWLYIFTCCCSRWTFRSCTSSC